MLLKILLKIWPSFVPIGVYVLWVIIQQIILNKAKNKGVIDGEFEEVGKEKEPQIIGHFSLKNPHFVKVVYLSLVFLIVSFLFFLLNTPNITEGKYVPAYIENGKVIPAKIVK